MSSKQAQWTQRLQAWERSGQTCAAFCRARGLKRATFDYWRRRLRANGALVPVVVTGRSAAPVEIVLPNGLRVRLTLETDVAQVRTWVGALLSC